MNIVPILKIKTPQKVYCLHDVVETDMQYENIPAGSKGTIVYEYEEYETYEVEFIINGNSIVKTVRFI